MKKADLPFIEDLYENSCAAITNETSGKKRGTGYSQMITCLQSLPQYFGMGFDQSDFGEQNVNDTTTDIAENFVSKKQEVSEDIEDMYVKNKRSVLRMLGYDPFIYEEEEDKPKNNIDDEAPVRRVQKESAPEGRRTTTPKYNVVKEAPKSAE